MAEYDARTGRLSETERLRMLGVLDRWRREPIERSRESVEAELREIRLMPEDFARARLAKLRERGIA